MNIERDFKFVLYLLCIIMSIIIDFNVIGALIIKDIDWIINNWLKDAWIVLIPYFVIVHYIAIFKYKWMRI